MLKNIFIITFRNLWKDRFGTVINLLGFSTGIAAFLIIVSYLHHEFSYEKFNARADRIFRANIEIAVGGTAKMYTVSANIVVNFMKLVV